MRAYSIGLSSLFVSGLVATALAAPGAGSGAPTPAPGGAPPTTPATDAGGSGAPVAAAPTDPAAVPPEDMPTAVRMRRLEQQTQALKERAWQLKARVQMLKEQVLGGGVGSQVVITHANEMGSQFRLISLVYALDGTQILVRTDDTGEELYKQKSFDVLAGPISPGNHSIAAIATYRGHGYGVFEYLSKYTFTAKGAQAFTAGEGKIARVECKGFEKGGPTVPLEKRAAVECKVTQVAPEKPTDSAAPVSGAPTGATPPAPTTAPTTPPPTPATSAPVAAPTGK